MAETSATTNIVGPVDAGWTVVTLKDYVDTLFDVSSREKATMRVHYDTLLVEYDRRYQARFVAAEQAVKDAFAAQEKAIDAALRAQQAAVNKAELASDKRFESVNEFRSQLGDQARTFMPRSETEALLKSLSEKIEGLVSRMDRRDAVHTGGQQVWGYVFGAVGLIIAVLSILVGKFL